MVKLLNTIKISTILSVLSLLISGSALSQTKNTLTTAGTTSFTAPTGITSVTVQLWGAGGAGGGSNINKKAASGGGGGAYNFSNTVTVIPGTTYSNSVVVGAGGIGADSVNGGNGNNSSVAFGSSLSANGGKGGSANGINTSPIGDGGAPGIFSGGRGGSATQGANGPGGGGGSSAGTAANGNNGTSTTAGIAVVGGGAGGAAGAQSVNGSPGANPGGGGGGGGDKAGSNNTAGGNGGTGQAIISYFLLTGTSNATVCNATAATITVSGTAINLPVGSYTVVYNLSAPNASTNNTATMTVATAGTGTFATVALGNIGATTITITSITATLSGISFKTSYDNTGNANNKSVITVKSISTAGSPSSTPTLCVNTALTAIMHATTVATGIGTPTGLPTGVNASWSSNSITISGTPTSSGTYNYIIPLTGGCNSVNATGTITVNAASTAAVINGTATICAGSSTNLNIAITGGVAPYSVVYTDGSSNFTMNSYASGTNISVLPNATTTYTLVSVTGANGCVGTGNSSPAVVTIDSTTSTNGGPWSNGSPTAGKSVIFDGASATLGADFTACSLRLRNNAVVNIVSGTDVILNGAVIVEPGSVFTLNNNANLIQNIPAGSNYINSGNIVVKRNSSALKRLDYTLWSSPVTGQGLYAFSPSTFGNRFYTYRTNTNLFNNGDIGFSLTGLDANGVNGTDSNNIQFAQGRGYLIRTPWNHPTAATVWNSTFTGVPNNGDIQYTMTNGGAGQRFNLVGNPYPSPISISQFVSDNSTKITGTLYFWRETNNNSSNNAYCTWAGGTFASNNESQVFNPNGIIRTGQGFFVEALNASTSVDFKNGQRSSDNVNQFFKTNNVTNDVVETNRFWLNLTNTSGAFSQMAAGYMTNATDGIDLYDGRNINTGSILLNSILDNTDYTIQGKSLPFNVSDVIPLSYKITTAGTYTIAIDHVDGLFADGMQAIYLKDNLTSTEHNLQTGAYAFASNEGTFNNRFEIIYQSQLGTGNHGFTANNVIIYNQNNDFVVYAGNTIMKSIKVFDTRGRLLQEKAFINANQTTINGLSNEVLLVQITSEDGIVVTKKVIR
jgi:trimeric autotransporter adhesin